MSEFRFAIGPAEVAPQASPDPSRGSSEFACERLHCKLSKRACADRQRDASGPSQARNWQGVKASTGGGFSSCISCPAGAAIVAEIGASPKRSHRLLVQAPAPPQSAAPAKPGTRAERVRDARLRGLGVARERRLAKTHCRNGHDYATTAFVDGRGARVCRTCVSEQNAAYRAKRRAA